MLYFRYTCILGIHGEPGREMCILPDTMSAQVIARILVDGCITTTTAPDITTNTSTSDIIVDSTAPTTDTNVVTHTQTASHTTIAATTTVTKPGKSQKLGITPNTDRLIILLNNLGSLPYIQLYILCKEILYYCHILNIHVVRIYIGTYMTSLDMNGVSLSVMKGNMSEYASILDAFDLTTSATAWVPANSIDIYTTNNILTQTIPYTESDYTTTTHIHTIHTEKYPKITHIQLLLLLCICIVIIKLEPILSIYDKIVGDGDCGLVLQKGAYQILCDVFRSTPITINQLLLPMITIHDINHLESNNTADNNTTTTHSNNYNTTTANTNCNSMLNNYTIDILALTQYISSVYDSVYMLYPHTVGLLGQVAESISNSMGGTYTYICMYECYIVSVYVCIYMFIYAYTCLCVYALIYAYIHRLGITYTVCIYYETLCSYSLIYDIYVYEYRYEWYPDGDLCPCIGFLNSR